MFKTFVSNHNILKKKIGGKFTSKKNGSKNVFKSLRKSFSFFNSGGGGKNNFPKKSILGGWLWK